MKKHSLIVPSILLTGFLLGACDLDTNMQPIGNWTMSDPVLKPMESMVVLDEEKTRFHVYF